MTTIATTVRATDIRPTTCRRCVAAGVDSTVQHGGIERTLMMPRVFTDSAVVHVHDSNDHGQAYACTAGHCWFERWKPKCWCGWTAGETYGPAYEELPDHDPHVMRNVAATAERERLIR